MVISLPSHSPVSAKVSQSLVFISSLVYHYSPLESAVCSSRKRMTPGESIRHRILRSTTSATYTYTSPYAELLLTATGVSGTEVQETRRLNMCEDGQSWAILLREPRCEFDGFTYPHGKSNTRHPRSDPRDRPPCKIRAQIVAGPFLGHVTLA